MEQNVDRVKEFLRDRPIINISKLEEVLDIPKGTIRPFDDKPLPRKHIEHIEWYLEAYGYRRDGNWRKI